jgi:hypothetical protein
VYRQKPNASIYAGAANIDRIYWDVANSWELLQVDYMFVGIVVVGILGLITAVLFEVIERKLVPWKAE